MVAVPFETMAAPLMALVHQGEESDFAESLSLVGCCNGSIQSSAEGTQQLAEEVVGIGLR